MNRAAAREFGVFPQRTAEDDPHLRPWQPIPHSDSAQRGELCDHRAFAAFLDHIGVPVPWPQAGGDLLDALRLGCTGEQSFPGRMRSSSQPLWYRCLRTYLPYPRIVWHFGKVPTPQRGHVVQKTRIAPVELVTGHPAKAQASLCYDRLQPFQSQLRLGFERRPVRNAAFLPSLSMIVIKPLLGQEQAVIHQRVPLTTRIRPKDTDLQFSTLPSTPHH